MSDIQAQIARMRAAVREHNATGGSIDEDAFIAAAGGDGGWSALEFTSFPVGQLGQQVELSDVVSFDLEVRGRVVGGNDGE